MKKTRITYIKNVLLPCLVLSGAAGVFTGGIIFLFKLASGAVIGFSTEVYSYVRANPLWLPCLLLGAAALGLLSALILKNSKNCRGGGIPTSVAILRGLIEFRWLKSIFFLFASALITFLGGVPLGNEGPSVQMGTAVGRGTVRIFAPRHRVWDRYIITGGACGGFAVATGAPLAGIIFALEEAHRRFSPMIFMTAAMTVSAATATMRLLCSFSSVSPHMFDLNLDAALPLKYSWVGIVIGIACGLLAVAFTGLYAAIGKLLNQSLKKLPFTLKIVLIFVLVALAGFASAELIGSGHDLIHHLTEGHGVWYMLLIYFCLRALFLMLANQAGISGGLFVPTLTFGAIIGAIFAKIALEAGFLPEEYFVIPIVVGMASFLSAYSRTPITAIAFALEALSGLANILPIAIGVTIAFLVIETWGVTSLHDTVINQKVANFNRSKELSVIETEVTVMPGAFAVGREPRDILWPPTCTVLSIKKPHAAHSTHAVGLMDAGDRLRIHYQTYEPRTTLDAIEAIVGVQPASLRAETQVVNENSQIVPEN